MDKNKHISKFFLTWKDQIKYNMTRKEERERKARIRADQYSHPVEWNECYHHWIEGAEWADKTMIDKVCKWIEENYTSTGGYIIANSLRKAMEK